MRPTSLTARHMLTPSLTQASSLRLCRKRNSKHRRGTITNLQTNQLSIDRSRPGIWNVSVSTPPINMLDEGTIEELHGLIPLVEQDDQLKVVIFESADPDFFLAHYDTSRAGQSSGEVGPTGYRPWTDFVLRLGRAPV